MTLWYGFVSGSSDPLTYRTDLDPDPALLVSDVQDANKKYIFFAYYFLKVQLHYSSKIKSHKEGHKTLKI
jgi:hypothetical protein